MPNTNLQLIKNLGRQSKIEIVPGPDIPRVTFHIGASQRVEKVQKFQRKPSVKSVEHSVLFLLLQNPKTLLILSKSKSRALHSAQLYKKYKQ